MAQKDNNSLYDGGHLHISDEVARLISPETGNEEKHRAIAGQLPLSIHDQIMLWYLFYIRSQDEQVKKLCLEGVERSSVMALKPILRSPDIDLHILEFILRGRRFDLPTLIILRPNRSIPQSVWEKLFSTCSYEILSFFFDPKCPFSLNAGELRAAADNRQTTAEMRSIIETRLNDLMLRPDAAEVPAEKEVDSSEEVDSDQVFDPEMDAAAEDLGALTKYQMVQELSVGDKIKLAMSGDKEWRTLLLKDSNKQVSGAVLKNPRITEKEVLIVCQNRSSHEELIRIILLNREWLKNYSIRLALTMHPRTPLNQAIRFLPTLGEKELRILSKSRNISSALVNACRRILMAKYQR